MPLEVIATELAGLMQHRAIRRGPITIMNHMGHGQFAIMKDNYNDKQGHLLFKTSAGIVDLNDAFHWNNNDQHEVWTILPSSAVTLVIK